MSNGLAKKRIALFGSTGSIGKQALEVIDAHPSIFSVEVLTAQNSDELLIKQAIHFKPNIVVIGDPAKYPIVKAALSGHPIKVFGGGKGIGRGGGHGCV